MGGWSQRMPGKKMKGQCIRRGEPLEMVLSSTKRDAYSHHISVMTPFVASESSYMGP